MAMATETRKEISLDTMQQLPNRARHLLAYCLECNSPQITLLESDSDVDALVAAAWIVEEAVKVPGVRRFLIPPDIWARLKALEPEFLTPAQRDELDAYKRIKNKLYPWTW